MITLTVITLKLIFFPIRSDEKRKRFDKHIRKKYNSKCLVLCDFWTTLRSKNDETS